MRIAAVCPPSSALFLPPVEKLLRSGGHETFRLPPERWEEALSADAVWAEWAGRHAALLSKARHPRLVVRLHRYEVDEPAFREIDWNGVRCMVATSRHVARRASIAGASVIPSIVDFDLFPLYADPPGDRLAVVGNVIPRKCVDAAVRIAALAKRPLTILGATPEPGCRAWVEAVVAETRADVTWEDAIPHDRMGAWWADKAAILSCSVDEGCPYSVIEAMACGRAPIVRAWEGAGMFGRVWQSQKQAARFVSDALDSWSGDYPREWREFAAQRFSIEANREAVLSLFEE